MAPLPFLSLCSNICLPLCPSPELADLTQTELLLTLVPMWSSCEWLRLQFIWYLLRDTFSDLIIWRTITIFYFLHSPYLSLCWVLLFICSFVIFPIFSPLEYKAWRKQGSSFPAQSRHSINICQTDKHMNEAFGPVIMGTLLFACYLRFKSSRLYFQRCIYKYIPGNPMTIPHISNK